MKPSAAGYRSHRNKIQALAGIEARARPSPTGLPAWAGKGAVASKTARQYFGGALNNRSHASILSGRIEKDLPIGSVLSAMSPSPRWAAAVRPAAAQRSD